MTSKKLLLYVTVFLLGTTYLLGRDPAPRIIELLPDLICPLAIEPGIPSNFVALSPNGKIDPYHWIYWGPKEVLEAYFKDPTTLNSPILRVRLSGSVTQIGPSSFSKELIDTLAEMKKQAPSAFAFCEVAFGGYPVTAVRSFYNGQLEFTAWVGLNDPEQGWTLVFNLVYPQKKGHPNKLDCLLWKYFLTETRPLFGDAYIQAYGQQMEMGYTLISIGGAKLMMSAEERKCDGKLQVVFTPLMDNVTFECLNMEEFRVDSKGPSCNSLLKVTGTILKKDQDKHLTSINYVTSIFVKQVSEFSVIQESPPKKKYNFICQPVLVP